MPVTVEDLKEIASRGGGFIIDSAEISSPDLKEIASRATQGGVVTIRNAGQLTSTDLMEIASRSQGHVVFDFTS